MLAQTKSFNWVQMEPETVLTAPLSAENVSQHMG
jgi:hypothetical protein